jgi:hypothetical protein
MGLVNIARGDPDALKAYGSTIEEARADLFGLITWLIKNWLSSVYFLMKKHISRILYLLNEWFDDSIGTDSARKRY